MVLMPLAASAQELPEGEFGSWPFPGSVDALPEGAHPGKPFNGFPSYQRTIDWMAIPAWLAGDWMSKDYRIMKSFDHNSGSLRTIPTSSVTPIADHFGDQLDKQGTVWSCNFTPFIMNVPVESLLDSQMTIGLKPIEVRDDQVALWQRVLHIIHNPANNSIHDSYTEERVTEFQPQGPGMIMAKSTSRFYNPNGDPTFTTNALRIMRLTTKFRPQQQRAGINLPMSLSEHLQATGRGDLIQ